MKRIYLIGYMGAGKTTLGRLLAETMQLSFIDLDHFIENRYSKSVGQLFQERGEDEFRRIETNMLREVSLFENIVISTGGGTPVFYDNMTYMNRMGLTVYLRVSVKELANRLNKAKSGRPLIRDKSEEELEKFISETLSRREPVYLSSKRIFSAEELDSPTDIQSAVVNLLKCCEGHG
ncbi:MAG: shikimate kinase [Bacteroidales bacterium]|nr:shikimate kinase [Bacteroidales bacterium]